MTVGKKTLKFQYRQFTPEPGHPEFWSYVILLHSYYKVSLPENNSTLPENNSLENSITPKGGSLSLKPVKIGKNSFKTS